MDRIARKKKVEPVTVAFKDLWYTVAAPGGPGQPARALDLLKGITGYALPGSITALMGSTGAGKTTLMDVIAGRKTGGTIRGQILLNGFEASDLSIRRCTGYCEQTDIHSKASTFREALTFSAFLRQGAGVPDSDKFDTVDECLELLGLDEIADRMIRGSSMEKMKRLTIGVEMAAQPSVLFLDEPTSGLDARSAKVIMDGVRKVADSGRTVLCTIHQPSSDVFHLFNSLLLLKKGGETVYFGELGDEARAIVDYFQSIPSVPRLKRGYNPATWMLEVIGAGVAERGEMQLTEDINIVHVFDRSASKVRLDAISFMLMGFNPPANQIPSGYKWLYTVSPHRYSFAALVGTVFGECSEDQLAEIQLATASAATVVSVSATSVSSTNARTLASIDISKYPLGCQMLQHAPPEIGAIPIQTYVDQVFGVVHDETVRSFDIFLGMMRSCLDRHAIQQPPTALKAGSYSCTYEALKHTFAIPKLTLSSILFDMLNARESIIDASCPV